MGEVVNFKKKEQEIIKFSVNHWSTEYYPAEDVFDEWMDDYNLDKYLRNTEFAKENKLVVVWSIVDMSISFAVTAPKEFVDKYCPCLYEEKYKEFVFPEDAEYGIIGVKFKEWSEENIGVWFYDNIEDEFESFESDDD